MQKNALYSVIAAGLLLGAAGVNALVPRIPPPTLRVVPVENLPRTVGTWRGSEDLPTDAKTRRILPASHFLTRNYMSPDGESIGLLLQSSPLPGEYHTPTVCLPTQGWGIVKTMSTPIEVKPGTPISSRSDSGEAAATEMWMEEGSQKAVVLYWYTSEQQLDKWQALAGRFAGGKPGARLFVRLIAPVRGRYEATSAMLHSFGASLRPSLADLER